MKPTIKQKIEEEALRRFPEDEYDDEYFTERYYFKEGAKYGYSIKESVNEKLVEALKQISACCDNQNETHEGIWRIAHEAIQSATKNTVINEGEKCLHSASERIGETKLWCCNLCGKRVENF